MNIFVTSECPVKAAQEHNNVHLRKMIVEVLQMLSTAHEVLDNNRVAYKATHVNHPCSIWIRGCSGNYEWALKHFIALCEEYKLRTGKNHKSSNLIDSVKNHPVNIKIGERTPFALAMPDEYKKLGVFNQTIAYQKYLIAKFEDWLTRDKPIDVSWGTRQAPEWYTSALA